MQLVHMPNSALGKGRGGGENILELIKRGVEKKKPAVLFFKVSMS